jgi:hypothetical protein
MAWCLVKHRNNFAFIFYLTFVSVLHATLNSWNDDIMEQSLLPFPFYDHDTKQAGIAVTL